METKDIKGGQNLKIMDVSGETEILVEQVEVTEDRLNLIGHTAHIARTKKGEKSIVKVPQVLSVPIKNLVSIDEVPMKVEQLNI
jgi:hypothetical protein